MLVRHQPGVTCLIHHRVEEGAGDIRGQQSVAILTERRRRPDRLVQAQADEPAKQDAVVDLLHQQPLTANRVEPLQQQGPQQLLGRNGGPPHVGVHPLETRRELAQDLIGHQPDRAQRVMRSTRASGDR